jgi:hypothetical protein
MAAGKITWIFQFISPNHRGLPNSVLERICLEGGERQRENQRVYGRFSAARTLLHR